MAVRSPYRRFFDYPEPKVESDRKWRRSFLFRYRLWAAGRKFTYGPQAPRVGPWFASYCLHNRTRRPIRGHLLPRRW